MAREDKLKALDAAISQIEKQYGKGSIMKLGDNSAHMNVETIPTGSLSLDIALGLGGLPSALISHWGWAVSQREELLRSMVRNPVVRQRLPCMRLPRYRKGAESQDLLMRSMHLIRLMPRISV